MAENNKSWKRTCPNCGRELYKENSDDIWYCDNCGWRE